MKTFDFEKFALNQLKPFERRGVVEWAEENVYLSERITEQAGSYSTANYPYVKEVLESFADPKVRHISLCWGSQTSKTTTVYIGVGYCVDQKPAPILMVYPTDSVARTFANDRLLPFLKDSECLAKRMPKTTDGKIDTDKITQHRMEFDRCSINLVGGGSRANVRNYPVSILVLDEIDIITEGCRREALDRVKGRRDYKVVQCSTPLEESTGIWGEYQNGDQRKFMLNCPHCLNEICLEWKTGDKYNIKCDLEKSKVGEKWDLSQVMKTTRYFCQVCDKPITDRQKHKMMKDGFWKPTAEKASHRSYHLSSLYSPILRFGEILTKWIQAQESIEGVKNFVQGWLAEPWRDEILNVSEDKINELEANHERGTINGDLRILSVDVQRSHYWWIVRGFNRDGESWLIDHGMAPIFEDLDKVFNTYECHYGIVDTGYGDRTQEMYEHLFIRRNKWFGVKGWKSMATPYKINLVDPFSGTNKQGQYKLKLIHLDTTVWQGELGSRRAGKTKGWHLYKNPDINYLRQLSSKWQHESVNKKGERKIEWRTKGTAGDHYWDCETYCLAFSKLVGFGRVGSEEISGDKSAGTRQNEGKLRRNKKQKPSKSIWN